MGGININETGHRFIHYAFYCNYKHRRNTELYFREDLQVSKLCKEVNIYALPLIMIRSLNINIILRLRIRWGKASPRKMDILGMKLICIW